jgi:hypothetical protein
LVVVVEPLVELPEPNVPLAPEVLELGLVVVVVLPLPDGVMEPLPLTEPVVPVIAEPEAVPVPEQPTKLALPSITANINRPALGLIDTIDFLLAFCLIEGIYRVSPTLQLEL